ncbi:hypothetical protein C4D60_Mb02t22070 [Musa balbisiana]|uniref:Uncharacterized protein n=1 Tax=Musa balbisiana TaxID=52838 RepID=A0A4S8ICI9_MUSBA|nr:hypothetical protein C4D60_Mb02t22070 [Musa balbisiana]
MRSRKRGETACEAETNRSLVEVAEDSSSRYWGRTPHLFWSPTGFSEAVAELGPRNSRELTLRVGEHRGVVHIRCCLPGALQQQIPVSDSITAHHSPLPESRNGSLTLVEAALELQGIAVASPHLQVIERTLPCSAM